MRPTDHLQSLVAEDWHAATHHRFTGDLVAGRLTEARMLAYLRQDHLFLGGFVRLLASAIAHAPTLPDAIPAAQFLALVTGPENTYFERAITALGGTVTPPAPAHPVTADFQALMAEATGSGSYPRMLAVLVVAEWCYLDWAHPHEDKARDLPFWAGEWITLHSGAGFEGVVAYLRDQLDRTWPKIGPQEQAETAALFARATRLERAFFAAALADFATA
ncbi:TenA family protein [Roseovarius autotrophicus]|uniref:TenA family protein n=1 Tax=Roseovarius autotrophicus TaxID=2824121 RepID=UPI001B38D65F|nr:TenA family protein [Roseovarius autotrophicus]